MKRLANFRRFSFVILLVLLTANLWGQSAANLSGEGTKDKPWQIKSPADWNAFTTAVNNGYSYTGEYILLENDLTLGSAGDSITTVVGDGGKKFQGTFNGNWKTIHLTMSRRGVRYAAPFGEIQNATIKNLTIDGVIRTNHKNAAGIAAITYGTDSIINCVSSIYINCNDIKTWVSGKPFDCTHGGLVGEVPSNGKLYITNCIFNGSIIDSKQPPTAQKCSGFVGYHGGNTLEYNSCTMAGTININELKGTFHRGNTGTFNSSYFITPSKCDDVQGSEITSSATVPTDDGIYKKYTVSSNNYYVPGAVFTGIETCISTGTELTPIVSYYGRTLTRGEDYDIYKGTSLVESGNPSFDTAGEHELSIVGKGDYAGTHTVTITVIEINSWADLKTAMSASRGIFTLTKDINADVSLATNTALVVSEGSTIVLNLDGHTINRGLVYVNGDKEVVPVSGCGPDQHGSGRVIEINSGASLTINGPGTITGGYHKAEDNTENEPKNDGGGIWNMGNLVMNDVTVYGNKIEKEGAVSDAKTGRGGGIYSGSGSSLVINGGLIKYNNASGGGGGIFSYEANLCNISNDSIVGNISEDKGAGVRIKSTKSNVTNITGCSFVRNSVTTKDQSKGGGIHFDGTTNLVVTDCHFKDNTACLQGGAIYIQGGTLKANNCYMFNNMSYDDYGVTLTEESFGGAVYIYSGNFEMNGGTITGDSSKTNGGGVYVASGAHLKVKGNVVINDNSIYLEGPNNVHLSSSDGVIEVIGDLGPDAIIGVTKNGDGTIVTGLEGHGSLSNFVIDDNSYRLTLDEDGNVVAYRPYIWDDETTWPETGLTVEDGVYTINVQVIIPDRCVAEPSSIVLQEDGVIVIEDGGQLVYNTESVPVKVQKNIKAATLHEGEICGWNTIASPVNNASLTSNTNLTTSASAFDMLYYDEPAHYWRSYLDHPEEFTSLTNGRGYMYRKTSDKVIEYTGSTNIADVKCQLSYASADGKLKGFNLIGNPYTHNIYKNDEYQTEGDAPAINDANLATGYYRVYTGDIDYGDRWRPQTSKTPIKPGEGILVQTSAAKELTIANNNNPAVNASTKRGAEPATIKFEVSNGKYDDEAYVMFTDGIGLNKINHLNENVPMMYIRQHDEDYAIATMGSATKSFDLNFKAMTTGSYTIKMTEEGEFAYIHLIDKFTGEDVDMLHEKEYTFLASKSDNANRFMVRLSPSTSSDTGSEIFAWQNGNDIIVEGNGELQVFDVMGRMVMRQNVNGVETMCTSSLQTGVYIFRLEGKAQKIVLR